MPSALCIINSNDNARQAKDTNFSVTTRSLGVSSSIDVNLQHAACVFHNVSHDQGFSSMQLASQSVDAMHCGLPVTSCKCMMALWLLAPPTLGGDRPHTAHAWGKKKGLTRLTSKGRPWGGLGLGGHPAWILMVQLTQQCCSLFLNIHAPTRS